MLRASQSIHHRAVTLIEVTVLLLVVALCICLMVFTLLRRTELERRAVCVRNLSAIERALWVYANENHNRFPVAGHAPATQARVGQVEYVRAIGSYRGRADDPQAGNTYTMEPLPTHLSTTRNLWTLYRIKSITRDQFICPSTKDIENKEPNARAYWDFGIGDIIGPATAAQSRLGYSQVSYGYQVPYGRDFRPSGNYSHFWPVADKGPFGAALEAGSPSPPSSFPTSYDSRFWRRWNSPNHGGEGQNRISGMSGVEFTPTPHGWQIDFMYTQCPPRGSINYIPGTIHGGSPPAAGLKLTPDPPGPMGSHLPDTFIYP